METVLGKNGAVVGKRTENVGKTAERPIEVYRVASSA